MVGDQLAILLVVRSLVHHVTLRLSLSVVLARLTTLGWLVAISWDALLVLIVAHSVLLFLLHAFVALRNLKINYEENLIINYLLLNQLNSTQLTLISIKQSLNNFN